ncbi:hypothetical protein [Levilactobacillus lindianensis]|uniref:hypothetical protein n=1 Tax=Levilactobacillus lindianensis TaxID=2486018 RepID=UPI000F740063|nr:hypothetical protein [Levilactobacillus lindianensis]
MFKTGIKVTAIAALLLGIGLFSPVTAHAQSDYKITSTQDVTPEPYYVARNISSHYSWDKTHTKRLTFLNEFQKNYSVYVTQKVTMTYKGKATAYLHIANNYGMDYGYVTAKSMRKGFNPTDTDLQPYQPAKGPQSPEIMTVNRVSKQAFSKVSSRLNKITYYRTTKKVKLNADFTSYMNVGSTTLSTTIPAGTIVGGYRTSNDLAIDTDALSQNFLRSGYRQGLWVAGGELITSPAKIKAFKQIKRPAYLPKYDSFGLLYSGGINAIRNQKAILSKQSVQITSNGYVEIRQNNPHGQATEYNSQPLASVKIKRTKIKGHTRYLYLAKSLKGYKTTKVRYHGKRQYRLALVNQQKTYAIKDPGTDEFTRTTYYGGLTFGGKTFYTSYGTVSNAK